VADADEVVWSLVPLDEHAAHITAAAADTAMTRAIAGNVLERGEGRIRIVLLCLRPASLLGTF